MYSSGKGIARRCLPYRKSPPSWVQISGSDIVEQIIKLAKKGSSPSQIGVTLRDSHGIPQVKGVTGSKILRILKKNGLAPQVPEDLYHLIKKAIAIRKHLEKFRKDKDAKFRLILVESRIHRLARYYRNVKSLPQPGNTTPRRLTPSSEQRSVKINFKALALSITQPIAPNAL